MKNLSKIYLVVLMCCGVFQFCVLAQQQSIKVAPVNLKLYELYAGNYRLADDRFISLGAFSENGDRLTFYDSKTRRVGVLYDLSETDFVSGIPRGNDSVESTDLRVTFNRNGRGEATGFVWREGDAIAIVAQKVSPHRNEEITFQNGDVSLRGTLTLPATQGRHPVVVLLQGSGAARRPFGIWSYFLARHGIATLVYDKRGAGASTGDWQIASFEDLAGDALAAVNLLRKHPNINAQQIGLWGNSNSGWVVPVVAARSKDVAFVISRVGSALPPHENILFEIENDARQRGLTEQEIKQAVALRQKYHRAIIANSDWETLRTEVERSRNERWFEAARMGRFLTLQMPPDATTLTGLRYPMVFDPMPFWERVTCPVLALYGEMDMNVPTARSVPMLDAALKRAGNRDYTITVLPNANHGLAEVPVVRSSEPPRVRRYASGYMDGIANWLLKRVSLGDKPSDVKERIAQLNREMENAFNRDEMLKVSAFYADDAEITGDNFSVKGRKEIDKYWLDLKGKGKSWKLQIVEIGGRDDLIYQLGVSDLVAVINGKEQKFVTNFIVLWKLQKDGSYKIHRDFITKAAFSKS